jgi:polyketide biosynthesis enoyl-CoA hydratase PksH
MTMDYRGIRVEASPDTMRVTLDRPDRRNGLDARTIAEIRHALDEAERRPDCRIVVLAGRPGVFCTGMDLAEAVDAPEGDGGVADFHALLRRISTTPRVVVAEVDGQAAGGGVGLAAACDLVLATPRSTFSLPEALWGLLPCAVLPFLVRRTGFQPAYAMTLTTRPVPAAEAHRDRLVDEVCDDPAAALGRLEFRVTKVATEAIGEAKRYFGLLWPVTEEAGRVAAAEFARLMAAPAVRDRIAAFTLHQRMPWETGAGGGTRPLADADGRRGT